MLPVPEIQYLAYLHNAEDQLRGEAASLRFFSGGAFTNPMVVRIAGLAYQKGFGGHFHNDNAVGGAARHPRPGGRRTVPPGGRRADAALVPVGGVDHTARSASSSNRSRCTTRRDLYEPR